MFCWSKKYVVFLQKKTKMMNVLIQKVCSLTIVICCSVFSIGVHCQVEVLNSVWLLNEGGSLETPSVGVYNPTEDTFVVVMEFEEAGFTTDVIVADGAAFAAAALPVITLYIQTATVVPGQLTAGTFAGTGSGPTIGATTTPGLIL